MDIRAFVYGQLDKGPYSLLRMDGSFNCQVDEVLNSPYYLVWFFGSGDISQAVAASYDIISVVPYNGQDYLRTVGGHIVQRAKPSDPWFILDVEEYFLSDGTPGVPEFPININDGDAAVIATSGTWKWHQNDPTLPPGSPPKYTGNGTWKNTTRYSLDKMRFVWDEEESEDHQDGNPPVPYHRVRLYDAVGWIGFNDVLIPPATIRRKDYL